MNPSRNSYSCPMDASNEFLSDVILHKCEFCSRTFIPDSLIKHRKICYRNYLKQKSKLNRKPSNSQRSRSSRGSCGDVPKSMQFNELMHKRQIRRMNWRQRHEEFIQSIRAAREYAIAIDAGLPAVPPPAVSVSSMSHDPKDELERCRYCLRKFHKDAFEKHVSRCKEYSIKNNKSRPNTEQIEAKRRLSLRLYYKPRSYRGDSPEDMTTSMASDDIDCPSLISSCSTKLISDRSKMSIRSTQSANPNMKTSEKPKSISLTRQHTIKSQSSKTIDKSSKSLSTKEPQKTPTPIVTATNSVSTKPNNTESTNINNSIVVTDSRENLTKITNKVHKLKRSKTIVGSNKNDSNRNRSLSSATIAKSGGKRTPVSKKMKDISNILKTPTTQVVNNYSDDSTFSPPDPAESLRQAKAVLKFLDSRIQQYEVSKKTTSPDSSQIKGKSLNDDCDFDRDVLSSNDENDEYINSTNYNNFNSNEARDNKDDIQIISSLKPIIKTVTTEGFNYKECHPKAMLRDNEKYTRPYQFSNLKTKEVLEHNYRDINITLDSNMSNIVKVDTSNNNEPNTSETDKKIDNMNISQCFRKSLENINGILSSKIETPKVVKSNIESRPVERPTTPIITCHPDPEYARIWQRTRNTGSTA